MRGYTRGMSDGPKTRARNVVRTFNKYVLNPVMRLPAAESTGTHPSSGHTGRRAGKTYTTPVVASRWRTAS